MGTFFNAVVFLSIVVAAATTTIIEDDKKRGIRGRQQTLMDPKNVEQKPNNRELEAKPTELKLKPTYGIEIFDEDLPMDLASLQQLRYVTFGSSHTWGSGIEREEGFSRYKAFPYLLSPDVDNMALRAHDIGYPALCAESMLGDKIYDVAVILEMRIKPWNPNDSTHILGRRLRERFPDIIIVYVNHIYPQALYFQGEQDLTGMTSLNDWEKQHAQGLTKSDPLYLEKMKEYSATKKRILKMVYDKGAFTEKTQKILGENTFFIDLYSASGNDGLRYMELFGNYTCLDNHHPCHVGHRKYADAIQRVVQKVINKTPTVTATQRSATSNVAPWKPEDKCESWFDPHGLNTMDINVPSKGFQFNCFEPRVKCSLELVSDDNTSIGSITIDNPNNTEQYLAITFMAASAGHPSIRYPKVKVETIDSSGKVLMEKIADTTKVWVRYGHNVHIAKLLTLGKIPPGKTTIQFTYLDSNQAIPFRLVSYLITEQKAVFRGVSP
eukprot:CAMPEP_0178905950 /NCGR_PEP_ID=MMETSP0786-20121207/6559_1 /TAXON_ID=186022 /ORGANISM="Thalassionema frauenfeldii, Strain CCMP 1798" /LENGTH=495 /DNA_ID=CAMNT_0020577613 /DNA_START=51 /DNA_END=1534 /DNA_ORIENTATION=+